MVHPTQDGERLTSTPLFRPVLLAKITVMLAVWLGALSYVLILCSTEGRGLCTTWGCRPTFETLPLFHAFWLIAFLPPTLFVASVGPPKLIQRLAVAVFLLGIGMGVYDTIVWAGLMAERSIYVQPMEYAQRWGYRLATSVIELPLLAIPVAAGVAWIVARLRASRLEHKSERQS